LSIETAIATLEAKKTQMMQVVPNTMRDLVEWEHIVSSVADSIRANPKLQNADPVTVYLSTKYLIRLGLDIGGYGGQGFLVPFWNSSKQCYDCTAMVGVRGKETLAYRSGFVDRIMSNVFHANDVFDYDLGSGDLTHKYDLHNADRGPALASWARVWLKGSPHPYLEIMTEADFVKIRDGVEARNKGKLSPAYKLWPSEMRRNRVLSRALKRIPRSKDLTQVLREEYAIETGSRIGEDGKVHDFVTATPEHIPNVDVTEPQAPDNEDPEPKAEDAKTGPENENPAPKKGEMP